MPSTIIAKQSLNGMEILKIDTSPIAAGGLTAPIGSYATAVDGTGIFCKFGSADTDWYNTMFRDGWFNYADTATAITPIAATANTPIKLTNNGAGANSSNTYKPQGITKLWDTATNQFYFSELVVGDEITVRFNLTVITTSVNQEFLIYFIGAIGGNTFQLNNGAFFYKAVGSKYIGVTFVLNIGNNDTRTLPTEIMFLSDDDDASIIVKSFYISTKRRN